MSTKQLVGYQPSSKVDSQGKPLYWYNKDTTDELIFQYKVRAARVIQTTWFSSPRYYLKLLDKKDCFYNRHLSFWSLDIIYRMKFKIEKENPKYNLDSIVAPIIVKIKLKIEKES